MNFSCRRLVLRVYPWEQFITMCPYNTVWTCSISYCLCQHWRIDRQLTVDSPIDMQYHSRTVRRTTRPSSFVLYSLVQHLFIYSLAQLKSKSTVVQHIPISHSLIDLLRYLTVNSNLNNIYLKRVQKKIIIKEIKPPQRKKCLCVGGWVSLSTYLT